MKKTYLAKRNALFTSARISWGVLALAFALAVLLVRLIAPDFFWQTSAPIFKSADALAARSHTFLEGFGDTASLASRNEELANENAALAVENQALSQKLMDISALSDLQPSGRSALNGILAGVVARPPESPYDTLVLASGSNSGVALGQEAFGAGGVPLGVVSSVLADFSRVTLFSTPGTSITGWVGNSGVPLTLSGAGAGAFIASVPRSAGVAVGDTVFAPGPGKLPIGAVARVDSDPSSPSVVLRIRPTLDLFSVSWVVLRDTGVSILTATSSAL